MRSKALALIEIILVYAAIQAAGIAWRSAGIVAWEKEHLGWSYTGMLIFVGIPALIILLARRRWADYGVSLENWRTNLEIGLKAYLVQIIPLVLGLGVATSLMLNTNRVGGLYVALVEIVGLLLMVWVMNRQKPVAGWRRNLVTVILLLLFPVLLGLAMRRLSAVVVSTVLWQFVFSGFGEEFVWRGYAQSRLNQAFGRPWKLWGVQFGAGLIISAILFGLLHAFNTYDPAIGLSSLAWGWAVWTAFAGLTFGVIREKTGTLLAPGIAHGLPDAVGEAILVIFSK